MPPRLASLDAWAGGAFSGTTVADAGTNTAREAMTRSRGVPTFCRTSHCNGCLIDGTASGVARERGRTLEHHVFAGKKD
eukprot:472221-Alexandrium_andersonii.AAC.1